jgi:DNA (cytosine-5)-methyltransferase 1
MDFESETFIAQIQPGGGFDEVAHTLRGDGFDASEDGTGRGTPLVPVELTAFSCKDDGGDATSDLAPTMRSMNFDKSHANAGGQLAIAFNARQDGTGRGTPLVAVEAFRTNASGQVDSQGDLSSALTTQTDPTTQFVGIAFDTTQITSLENRNNPQPGDPCHPLSATAHPPAYATRYEIRRLTPVECCRLQGVPDDYLDIIYRGRPAADGPKYKALGNGFSVPVVRWIGHRIKEQEDAGV